MVYKKYNKMTSVILMSFLLLIVSFSFANVVSEVKAATTQREFIRIKIDSTSGIGNNSQLWNFFAYDNNGQLTFDEFNITASNYNSTYVCGLALTEEFADPINDHDQIVWTKKGVILGSGSSLSDDINGNYINCCVTDGSNTACDMDSGGNCETDVITDSDYLFQKSYGTLDKQKCGDDNVGTPCTGTASVCCALSSDYSSNKYEFKNEALCDSNGKWNICDDNSACASDGTNEYACNQNLVSGSWENCTSQGKTCSNGTCETPPTCGTNPQITISPTSQDASAGGTKTYTVTITNNDQSSCSTRTFDLTASGPSGSWTISLDKSSVTLSPGNNDTATLSVTSPSSASDGVYVASVIAEDSTDTSIKNSSSADYVIGSQSCDNNWAILFTSSKISKDDNYILDIKTPTGSAIGSACVYRYPISGIAREMWDDTFGQPIGGGTVVGGTYRYNDYDTGTSTGSYGLGTYRATLKPNDATACDYNSPCFDTVEVVECIDNSDCTSPETCDTNSNSCVGTSPPPPPPSLACPANLLNCEDTIPILANNCDCGGTPAIVNQYCCAADGAVFITQLVCQASPGCATGPPPATCGNGVIDDGEVCDISGNIGCADPTPVCQAGCGACAAAPTPPRCDPNSGVYCNPLDEVNTLSKAAETFLGYVLGLIGSVALLFLIIAGVMYMTSAGSEERIATSKRILTGAIIGLGIALLAYSLLKVIVDILNAP